MSRIKKAFSVLTIIAIICSCVEPIEIENIYHEDLLVIEASLNNELKHHIITLSRTTQLKKSNINYETNATISIIDNLKNVYIFNEVTNGTYESNIKFKAELDRSYTLEITTKDNKTYTSLPEKIEGVSTINSLETGIIKNNLDERGVSIHLKSSSSNGKYFRYEYEETYRIISPYWSFEKLNIISETRPFKVELVTNNTNNKVCYNTIKSNNLLLTETTKLSKNDVDFEMRFIKDDDFIIASRYSVLAKQSVLSFNAYNYYKTLQKLSNSGSVFTQNQPGFIQGNIF